MEVKPSAFSFRFADPWFGERGERVESDLDAIWRMRSYACIESSSSATWEEDIRSDGEERRRCVSFSHWEDSTGERCETHQHLYTHYRDERSARIFDSWRRDRTTIDASRSFVTNLRIEFIEINQPWTSRSSIRWARPCWHRRIVPLPFSFQIWYIIRLSRSKGTFSS